MGQGSSIPKGSVDEALKSVCPSKTIFDYIKTKSKDSYTKVDYKNNFLCFKRGCVYNNLSLKHKMEIFERRKINKDATKLKRYKFRVSVHKSDLKTAFWLIYQIMEKEEYKNLFFKIAVPEDHKYKYTESKKYLKLRRLKPILFPICKALKEKGDYKYLGYDEDAYYNFTGGYLQDKLGYEWGPSKKTPWKINAIKNAINEFSRLYLGGQFTIYVYLNADKHTEQKLLKTINYNLLRFKIRPGLIPESDFKLSPFLSTRIDLDKTFEYVRFKDPKSKELKKEQESNLYFQYLKKELKHQFQKSLNQSGHYPGNRF